MKVFVDFHHSSLLRSLIMLFEDRLGMEVYRPIGMEWVQNGFWAVYSHPDTAKQFLSLDQAYKPTDGSPALNQAKMSESAAEGIYYCADPGGEEFNRACTFDYFRTHQFDLIIASIPEHVAPFQKLIERYQPNAKLIFQIGNNWPMVNTAGMNVLASIKPGESPPDTNVQYYHQEFPLDVFYPSTVPKEERIYSFINILQHFPVGWGDFTMLERMLKRVEFRSFGGQCRDGSLSGHKAVADKMREAQFIFQVKDTGDGFGHVIYNAYAVGRPIITRSSLYARGLASELLVPGTYLDLDQLGPAGVKAEFLYLNRHKSELIGMGVAARQQFEKMVDYNEEEKEIRQWLKRLN